MMLSIPLISHISDKEYFTISEVSQVTHVPKYTLRYWELEFKFLHPIRKKSGHRRYQKEEIELIFKIKDLLYNKQYTIEGVKKCLVGERRRKFTGFQTNSSLSSEIAIDSKFLKSLKDDLKTILKILKS
jgi:DNA-binding transcriptional MerR regulator